MSSLARQLLGLSDIEKLKEHLGINEGDLDPLLIEMKWGLTLGYCKVMCFIGPPQSGKTTLISALSLLGVHNDKEKLIRATRQSLIAQDTNQSGSNNTSQTSSSTGNNRGRIFGADDTEKSVTFAGELALMDTRGFLEDNYSDNDESYKQVIRDIEVCRPNGIFPVLRSGDVKSVSQNKERALETLKKSKKIHTEYVNSLRQELSKANNNATINIAHEIIITRMDEYDPDFFQKFYRTINEYQLEYVTSASREFIEKSVRALILKEEELKREKEKQTKLDEECKQLRSDIKSLSSSDKSNENRSNIKNAFYMIFSSFDSVENHKEKGMKESQLALKMAELTSVQERVEILEDELKNLEENKNKPDPVLIEKSYAYAISKYVEYLSDQKPKENVILSVENDLIKKLKKDDDRRLGDLILEVFKEHFNKNDTFQSMLKQSGYPENTKIHFIFNNTAVNVRCCSSVYNDLNWGIESFLDSIKRTPFNTFHRNKTVTQKMKVNLALAITRQFYELIQKKWRVIKDVGPANVKSTNDIPFIINLLVRTLSIIDTSKDPKRTYAVAVEKLSDKFDEIVEKRRKMGTCDMIYFFGGFLAINLHYHPRLCNDVISVAEWATKFYMGIDETTVSPRRKRTGDDDDLVRSYVEDFSSQAKKKK